MQAVQWDQGVDSNEKKLTFSMKHEAVFVISHWAWAVLYKTDPYKKKKWD